MKRFKKLSTTFLTTVLLACNTITSPGFNVWAQEEKIPIDNPSDVDKSIEEPVEETIVPEEPALEEPVINEPSQNHEVSIPQTTAEEPVEQEQFPSFEKSIDMKDGPTVKVNAPEGAFPRGIQVDIQKVDVDTIYDLLHAQDETIKKEEVIALDFDFYTENLHHIEPKQKISITLQNLNLSKDTKATLYHLPDKNAKPEKKELATFDTNKKLITFESSSFSIYALIVSLTETSETIQPETVVTPEEQPAEETEDPSTSTDLYDSSINLAPGTSDAYYGGEIITVYDNISISGNNTVVPEGAYTIVSLPKASFQKPRESEVSTSFDNFKSLEIKETDTDYQIILTYKTLYGGYNGGTPIRVNLLPGQVINNSQHTITQQFFNKDGKKLTQDSTQIIKAKATIETLQKKDYEATQLIKEVDSDFVIKEGTYVDFIAYYYSVNSNKNDPRDRRLYAKIPEGTKVKENTGWTYEPETNRYYRDIPRDKFNDGYDYTLRRYNTYYRTITLDLGGIDLSSYDASNKSKEFRVDFSIQPVVDGIVQNDLGPNTGYYSKPYYVLKEIPKPQGASPSWDIAKYEKIIDKDYQPIDGSTYPIDFTYKYTTISYNKDYLYTHRMRYTLKNINVWSLSNANREDESIRELTIRDSRVDISPYVEPHQIRLMVIGLNEEDAKWMKEQLTGTKAYGITSSGQKVLISDHVPIHIDRSYNDSFDGEDWQTLSNTENYTKVEFVYPNGGVTLKGKDQIERCKYAIYSDVIGRVKESTYQTLKEKIDAHQEALLGDTTEYANTSITTRYYKFAGDTELTSQEDTRQYAWTTDFIRMQIEKIIRYNRLSITNGSQFFTNDTISTQEAYRHSRIGNFSEATQPENLNVYYLVPDGLEPVEDTSKFESIEVIRGYRDGMNLVIAKPKSITIPKLDGSLSRDTDNWLYLDFTVTTRLDIGNYTIYSCMSYDNNKIGVDPNGNQYGILQDSSPSGVWSTILKDANNRPDDNTRFTNFNASTFKIYPPKVLSAIKEVKLTSEPDSKYASSLGSKATIGDQIDYRWVLKNNSNAPIDQLEILDILPDKGDHAIVHNEAGEYPARGSLFTTPLLSIEDNSKFDYYYSTDPVKQTTQENYKANWSSSVDDLSKVTMIKAVLKKGQTIPVGENAYIITHNQIVNDPKIQDGDKAYNSFAYTLNEGTSFMEALRTEVQVTYPKRDVLVEKVNVEDDSYKLFGATFNLYEEGTGENGSDKLILSDVVTNHDGIATFPNLLVGKEYYLQETKAPSGYVKTDTKTYFTVKPPINDTDVQKILIQNDVPRTTMHLQKEWIGPQNAQEVTIHILANEKDTGQTVVLKAVDDWKTSVENLPVNDKNGNPIAYSIQEDAGKNYSSSIRGDMESGFVITNTNTEKRDVSVSKTWIGPKQDSVQVTLIKDGTPTDQTLTLQEANEWKSSFEDLIKYDPTDGHEIVYTVQENEISDYSLQMTGDMDNGFVLTNTNTETLSISVTKSWIGPVQSQAQITLVKDGALTEQTLTLNQENGWKASFDNLAKYDATDGHKIEYTIQEAPVENYTSKITGSMEDGFTVTNTNTETVSIPVEKHWIGPMTDSVDITLVKDEEDTENTLVLNAQNEWKDSFENLPKYDEKDGHLIDYKIKETVVKDYTSKITGDSLNGFVATNTNVHTISIPVQKVWVGPALDSIEVSLLRDEQETGQVLTLTKDLEWKSSFNDLLEFDPSDGHRYVYSLKEADVPGYKSLITGTQDTGFTITNTITGKVSVGITKQWIGKAADSVTVDLMNGDQKIDSIELSASNHWQYTFTNLEQYDENGQPISYTISEVNLDGYVSKITGNMNTGFVITNTNTETVDIPVEKSWIGPEGKQAEVNLYKDGIDQIASLVLSESNQWTSAFTDLPVYDSNDGHKIMYAIKETPIDGYQSEITGDAKSGYRIVNTNIETLSVSVKKQWIGPAQAKATFTLYQDGKKTNQTLVLSKQDQWQGSFTDLAKYDHNDGHAYVYTIEETQLPDYDSKVEGNMKDGFTVTNTNTEAVNVPVEKKWIGPAASKVDILLVKDGIETDRKLTLNEWNHWKGAFNDLTKYDSKDGHEIQYAIKEIPIADYSSDIKQTTDGYVVTNTNMKTRSISVEKRWIGPKADQVMVALYADGKDTGQSLTLSEENEWKAVFDGLSQYDSEDGHEISYSIQEKELPNYTVSIEGDMVSGFVLTNTNVSKRNITVSKKWIGQEGKSATIYLKQDGQRVQTVRLTQECGWQYEFKDLVMYDVKDGHAISYEIEEEEQPGYTSKITGNMEGGFIATNTQITSDSKSKGSTPTGESFDGTSMIVLAITSVVMLIALWIVKRKGL
ncbi:Cna B-type domain-containing protein [Faecalicoccus pleomorphus]|uniref:Cna B-type domain-containing protein n=1 Tax=Faecalicoccus pleomorphus TaxID=1323 RepID=A0AAW6CSA2_9FIRM|nr:Cna B-type domain-containing protein [Faecalicoccus pleomorphus]MDB7979003.1 Cna B-type domain-containing protein [Faecalicoccus pleomorphus]MDB7981282.1 Cna B-type domain-containing protein [Faecalicoccus pleomorphus]